MTYQAKLHIGTLFKLGMKKDRQKKREAKEDAWEKEKKEIKTHNYFRKTKQLLRVSKVFTFKLGTTKYIEKMIYYAKLNRNCFKF